MVDDMILSASGWRGIFAKNGDEESALPEISREYELIVSAAAKVFSDYLSKNAPEKNAVVVGRDTRPTGEAITDAVIRSLLSAGREVIHLGIAAAPEIMAFARSCTSAAGFIYISASHNPIGHNGLKFGMTDGGVLQASENAKLVAAFNTVIHSFTLPQKNTELENKVYAEIEINKKAALNAYSGFSNETVAGAELKKGIEKRPMSIAADFNGSARTVSIDRDFFASLGLGFYAMNDIPGKIAHRIVPEGESLEPCRAFIKEIRSKDPSVILGYVPDCDGDRGNLIIWDEGLKRARALEAQEVFALACLAELSYLAWKGGIKKTALAVNDPTSLRIDRIAKVFGIPVFRAEVGEANVVGLAKKLREQGYLVRILGEGSAGGTIIHPSAVRDPLNTVCAILKLLAIDGVFKMWCEHSSQAYRYRDDFSLADVIASLPAFVSTGSYSDDAVLKIKTSDHAVLKNEYQKIFLRQWEEKKDLLLAQYRISGWDAIAYNGMTERRGIKNFGEAGKGGLKIEFFGSRAPSEAVACIWMRGSATEPVFRIMADAESVDLERYLIQWQRQMVQKADLELSTNDAN